jgi:hypothetical protein
MDSCIPKEEEEEEEEDMSKKKIKFINQIFTTQTSQLILVMKSHEDEMILTLC